MAQTFTFEEAMQPPKSAAPSKTFTFEEASRDATTSGPRIADYIKKALQFTPVGAITSLLTDKEARQDAGNIVAGAVRGAAGIGTTLRYPLDRIDDMIMGDGRNRNKERRAALDPGLQAMGADTDSLHYQGGKLGSEIAGTAGAGPVLGGLAKAGGAAPAIVNALTTSGMRAGTAPGTMNMLTRIGGGAATGGAMAGLVDPDQAGTGAVIGGALPPSLALLKGAAKYGAGAARSLVEPFTAKGQEAIAGRVLNRFADGGPTAINNAQIVPGSTPTLAEATGNAGLATLQRGARDIRPNAFAEREAQNATARLSAFDDVAGDAGKLSFFRGSRDTAADDLYTRALDQANQQPLTPYIKGQVTQLLKRPSIAQARKEAQKLAMERGEKPDTIGNLRSLHDVKTALDDQISTAIRGGESGKAKALSETKNKLLDVMEKLSPDYREARVTYQEMSKPINAMEALQGLRITDAQGNITLAKVQNAIKSLENARNARGVSPAKSIADDQMSTLLALRGDLLRQSNLGLGKSIGSNTFQNIATDNILASALPGKIGTLAQGRVGPVFGQIGQLAYNKPNEAIRSRLVDLLLDPQAAQAAMNPQLQIGAFGRGVNALTDATSPLLYRSAPVISAQ